MLWLDCTRFGRGLGDVLEVNFVVVFHLIRGVEENIIVSHIENIIFTYFPDLFFEKYKTGLCERDSKTTLSPSNVG